MSRQLLGDIKLALQKPHPMHLQPQRLPQPQPASGAEHHQGAIPGGRSRHQRLDLLDRQRRHLLAVRARWHGVSARRLGEETVLDGIGEDAGQQRHHLPQFSDALLAQLGAAPYEQVMLVDGNDDRGIDVGILIRGRYPLQHVRTHIFDTDPGGVIFSRDCCEYHLSTPTGQRLAVLVNHLKSKGYSSREDPQGGKRRQRQATRIAQIYRDLRRDGVDLVAVVGDLNDHPASDALAPLLADTDLRDISTLPGFDFGPRKGTFGSGNEKDKIDYVLLSPALYAKATGLPQGCLARVADQEPLADL